MGACIPGGFWSVHRSKPALCWEWARGEDDGAARLRGIREAAEPNFWKSATEGREQCWGQPYAWA
jgi:hypothetical protein